MVFLLRNEPAYAAKAARAGNGRGLFARGVRFSPLPIVFTQAVCLASALA
jgi:hypothetical protein